MKLVELFSYLYLFSLIQIHDIIFQKLFLRTSKKSVHSRLQQLKRRYSFTTKTKLFLGKYKVFKVQTLLHKIRCKDDQNFPGHYTRPEIISALYFALKHSVIYQISNY